MSSELFLYFSQLGGAGGASQSRKDINRRDGKGCYCCLGDVLNLNRTNHLAARMI